MKKSKSNYMYQEKLKHTGAGSHFSYISTVLFFICLLTFSDLRAQSGQVEGKVSDEVGEPLPGVSVLIKGTSRGTVTDVNGQFILPDVKPTDYLILSFTGMQTEEIGAGALPTEPRHLHRLARAHAELAAPPHVQPAQGHD